MREIGSKGRGWLVVGMLAAALVLAGAHPVFAETTITLWSHEADEAAKVAWAETAARKFEQANPGVKVKMTWYQKEALNAALKAALRAGQGPDILYTEPDQTEYIDNGFLLPLNDLINWNNVEPWAREAWTHNGKVYGLAKEAYTIELYYNKDWMKKLGVTVPPNGQFSQARFLDIVKKAVAAGMTPLAQGVGDRPFPGAYLTHEAILKKLGRADYGKLLDGKLSWKDPRIVGVFTWVKQLVDAGAYPKSFATLKLGESHYYFHTKPGALMFPMGAFYTGRAFVPPDKGGQPENFPLGVLNFAAMDGGACNNCKSLLAGGSFSINASSKNQKLAGALLNEMATPEMGTLWLTTILLQTGIKSDPSKVSGKYAAYFHELAAMNKGAEYFIGSPRNLLKGQCAETYVQVVNTAFPGGLLPVDKALDMVNQACYKP